MPIDIRKFGYFFSLAITALCGVVFVLMTICTVFMVAFSTTGNLDIYWAVQAVMTSGVFAVLGLCFYTATRFLSDEEAKAHPLFAPVLLFVKKLKSWQISLILIMTLFTMGAVWYFMS